MHNLVKPLALVGLPGSGKSTLGRLLAERLHAPFRDVDAIIEQTVSLPITAIFDQRGEPWFRAQERTVISDLLASPEPVVLSLGGGAFMDPATRALLRMHGVSLWLRVPLDILVARIGETEPTPVITALKREGRTTREALESLLAERGPVYAEADLVVDVGTESLDETLVRVMNVLTQAALLAEGSLAVDS